jgi:hypothetical protein
MAKVTQLFLSAATSEFGEHRTLLSELLHLPELTVAEQDEFINSGGSTLEKLGGVACPVSIPRNEACGGSRHFSMVRHGADQSMGQRHPAFTCVRGSERGR